MGALFSAESALGAESQLSLPSISPEGIGYSVTHWTVEDGLPERYVTSLEQTLDGYLWCGSFSTLTRFDGERSKQFNPADTPESDGVQIQELRCDSKGRLWIGGSAGELVVYENRQFRRITEADGLPLNQAGGLWGDSDGDFWVKGRSNNKFYRYRSDRFEEVAPGVSGSDVDCFVADLTGLQWAVRRNDRTMIHCTSRGPESEPLTTPDGQSERTLGRFFRLQSDVLAVTSSHGVYALHDSGWKLEAMFTPTIPSQALDGVEDWDGNFWINFEGVGLVVCQPGGRTGLVSLPEMTKSSSIQALMLDMEGNVWVAGDDGVYRIRHDTFHPQPGLAETRNQIASAVVEDSGGAIWLLYSKGMARLKDGHWDYLPNRDSKLDLWTGASSHDGEIYLGYANQEDGEDVEKLTANGDRQRIGSARGYPRVILERRSGEIWTATDTGVWRLQKGRFERVPITGETGDYQVYAMIEDTESQVIVGAFRRGLFRQKKDGMWQRLAGSGDLGSTVIVALYFDEENTLWAATDRGLGRWKNGRWHAYSDAGGALPVWVRNVRSDKHGNLWLTSDVGVTRVERSVLNALADGKDLPLDSSWFDRSDGLPSSTCKVNQQSAIRASDGRIWIATTKGGTVADPSEWALRRHRRRAPQIKIEDMLVDDKTLLASGERTEESDSGRIVVPPGANRLEFHYTAINLTAIGRNRFRYRLDGVDKEWVDAGNQRSIVYHSLSPGDYRFRVTAANNYGRWNAAGDSLAFTIQPHWWQTRWFRVAAGITLLGLLWFGRSIMLYQLERQKVRREEFARQLIQSQEAERKRLAGDLHDDLGQELLIIKSRLDMSQLDSQLGTPSDFTREMANAVKKVIHKMRALSHGLRPLQLERLGLSVCARSMVTEVSEATGIHMETQCDEVRGLLSPDVEIGLYRMLQEALNNVVKHSDASEVYVTLKLGAGSVILTVSDDGRGFEPERLAESDEAMSHGLEGMRERCRLIGGSLRVTASPGKGTLIQVEVPLHECALE